MSMDTDRYLCRRSNVSTGDISSGTDVGKSVLHKIRMDKYPIVPQCAVLHSLSSSSSSSSLSSSSSSSSVPDVRHLVAMGTNE